MIQKRESKQKNFIDVIPLDKKEQPNYSFRVIISGEPGVGKTSIIFRHQNKSLTESTSTLCFDHHWINFKINDVIIRVQIWDTCGQEVYHSLVKNFFNSCVLVYIVFALDNMNSFNKTKEWLRDIRDICGEERIVILIGNKKDREKEREVSIERVQEFLVENNINYYIETSAFTGENIDELFKETASILYQEYVQANVTESDENSGLIDLTPPVSRDKNCNFCLCCSS